MKKEKISVVAIREEVKGTPAILISQAIAKGSDLDKLEKLLALQERFEANEARKAYHKAMTNFKANLPQIDRNKKLIMLRVVEGLNILTLRYLMQ